MKTKNSNILPLALLTTALLGLMIASGFVISAATAQSNTTETNATTNATTIQLQKPVHPPMTQLSSK